MKEWSERGDTVEPPSAASVERTPPEARRIPQLLTESSRPERAASINDVKPIDTDKSFAAVGSVRDQNIYMRSIPDPRQPGEWIDVAAEYRAGNKNIESFPHLAVQRDANGIEHPMTASEAQTAWTLVGEGKKVTGLTESRISGQETHDFLVNGQRTELWTPTKIDPNKAANTIKAGIAEKRGQGGADHTIVDTSRQPKVKLDDAVEAAEKALKSTNKSQLKDVRIMGDGFDVSVNRNGVIDNRVKGTGKGK